MKVKSILNGEDVNDNKERVERYVRIEGTPFAAVLNENEKWIILIGDAKVNLLEYESLEEAKDYIYKTDWDLMVTFVLKVLEICDIDISKFKKYDDE